MPNFFRKPGTNSDVNYMQTMNNGVIGAALGRFPGPLPSSWSA